MTALGNWTFTPFPPYPPTLFPNTGFWNATSIVHNLTYQIGISWPFQWGTSPTTIEVTNKTALTMYVLDGNAMGMTAAEGFKRRQPVSFGQPDSVVVSIGYPLTDQVYDFTNRFIDYKPPLPTPENQQGTRSGADAFINFINGALRPFVRETVFPNVEFTRDAVFGHSFGGLFVVYALIAYPEMFDTYLSASPALEVQNASILDMVTARFGVADTSPPASVSIMSRTPPYNNGNGGFKACSNATADMHKPALFISWGSQEQFPTRRRTETQQAFQTRKDYFLPLRMTDHCHELYDRIKASGKTRDVVLKEYAGQDHAGVAATAITDGIDYFVDW
ncbi:Alpha/Beta hydrolase protein [Podospora didyma]|uniref:Alpha/Beta hydrolase protein n=1 Tax=Podospora didyma TaxID=330526 RepID=A0AAE0NYE4_9PEZI|nr:Alpha/Beta hydrolase protein [Podospora didyma]